MKIYIWLSIAIILITALCVFSIYYINDTASGVLDNLDQVSESVTKNNWDKANQLYLQSEKEWNDKNDLLHAFIEHEELEQINVIFKNLGYYIRKQNLDEAELALIELDHFLHHLMEDQEFIFGNIF